MTHTILADNTAVQAGPDCHNAIDSEDYNLVESTLNCPMTNPGHDIVGEDPDLLALADNGGSHRDPPACSPTARPSMAGTRPVRTTWAIR